MYFAQSEDELGRPARKRGPVRFDQDVRSDVSQHVVSLFIWLVVKYHLDFSVCRLTS